MPTGGLDTDNLHMIINNILFLEGQDIAGDNVTKTSQFSKPLHVHSQIFLITLSSKTIYPACGSQIHTIVKTKCT